MGKLAAAVTVAYGAIVIFACTGPNYDSLPPLGKALQCGIGAGFFAAFAAVVVHYANKDD